MIPQNFEYTAPANLQEALGLIADGSAKVLAGGMSLIPLMKLRLAAPEHVVDISRIPGLSYIREEAGAIHVGAMTTHYEMEIVAAAARQVPAAGRDGVEHRRRAGAQYGHHRRQHRARGSGGGLSGRAVRARGQGAAGERQDRPHESPSMNSWWTR